MFVFCSYVQCPRSRWRTDGRRRGVRDAEEVPPGVLGAVDVIVRVNRATMRAVPILLLPPEDVPADGQQFAVRSHRDDSGRDTRLRLRAAGKRLRLYERPVTDGSGARIVWPAHNTIPVGRKLDVRWPGGHCRQRNGPRGRRDPSRRRLEHDGMSSHQVNDNEIFCRKHYYWLQCQVGFSGKWRRSWPEKKRM